MEVPNILLPSKGSQHFMRIDGIVLRELHLPLVRPFETSFGVTRNRRILLAEVRSEGLIGWGECTAGERPHFSGESTDTAWQVIVNELGPMLASAKVEHGGDCPRIFDVVRGNPMAKAALENAVWDLEAQREGISLSQLIGGVRDRIRVRRIAGHSEIDSGTAGHHRSRTGCGLPAHQAEVQTGLGCRCL